MFGRRVRMHRLSLYLTVEIIQQQAEQRRGARHRRMAGDRRSCVDARFVSALTSPARGTLAQSCELHIDYRPAGHGARIAVGWCWKFSGMTRNVRNHGDLRSGYRRFVESKSIEVE